MDVKSYLALVPNSNYTKPKYMSYLTAVLSHPCVLGSVTESMDYAFDLRNAAGKQLDTLGELVGVSRLFDSIPASGDRSMTDDEYRVAILMKIAKNEWDGSQEGALETYRTILSGIATINFYDSGDCNVDIDVIGDVRTVEIINNIDSFLVPAGTSKVVRVVGGNVNIEEYSKMQVVSEATEIFVSLT